MGPLGVDLRGRRPLRQRVAARRGGHDVRRTFAKLARERGALKLGNLARARLDSDTERYLGVRKTSPMRPAITSESELSRAVPENRCRTDFLASGIK